MDPRPPDNPQPPFVRLSRLHVTGFSMETVSRWENGGLSMGAAADRLLRLMVVNQAPVQDYSLEMLKGIEESTAKPLRLGVRPDEDGWHAVAA